MVRATLLGSIGLAVKTSRSSVVCRRTDIHAKDEEGSLNQ
jgi:hypothetical protein